MGCYGWRLQVVSWPSGGPHRASEVVASPWWRPFRSRFALKKRARKRGNLLIADTLRTNIQYMAAKRLSAGKIDPWIYFSPVIVLNGAMSD